MFRKTEGFSLIAIKKPKNALPARTQKGVRRHGANLSLTAMAIPGLICLLLVNYIPMAGLIIPFKKVDYSKGIFRSDWIDPLFKNFEFFFKSQDAVRVTVNTIVMNFAFIFLTLFLSVTLALCMYELGANHVKAYQTFLFVPYFISWVVASYIVYALISPDMGVVPNLFEVLGMKQPNFYNDPSYWRPILLIAYLWKNVGYNTLMYYTALMSMDSTLFEAAALDGASKLQRVRYINLPHLKPTIITLTVLNIGKILNSDFGMFYFLPRNSGTLLSVTDVIDTYVYRALRVTGDIGMSSAMGLFQSVVGFGLVLLTNYIVKKMDEDSALF